MIKRALEELTADNGAGPPSSFRSSLNVARPMSTLDELLFEVVRRLFEALIDGGYLRAAPYPRDVQRALVLSYTRTSLSFKETASKALERGRTLDLGPRCARRSGCGSLDAEALVLEEGNPLAGDSRPPSSPIRDADVEHDFLRIVSLVHRAEAGPPAPARRWTGVRGRDGSREAANPWLGHLVVVIDELDKLTELRRRARSTWSKILAGLKNLSPLQGCTSSSSPGPDLHDRALKGESPGQQRLRKRLRLAASTCRACGTAPGQLLDRLVLPEPDQHDEWYALLARLPGPSRLAASLACS